MQSAHESNGKQEALTLSLSLELSTGSWKVAATHAGRSKPAVHTLKAGRARERLAELIGCIEQIKVRWQLGAHCRIWVLHEAGQDGFWIARALLARGVRVLVADAASIPVARQARRAKTDRLDALMLLECLQGWLAGQRSGVRIVHLPEEDAEAQRQASRERGLLQKEIGQHRDRIRKLLRTVGCWDDLQGDLAARLAGGQLRCWDGHALPEPLARRLQRECERLGLAQAQFAALEAQLHRQLPAPLQQRVAQLSSLRGVGWVGAMRLVLELYWRNFGNRRQVGSCVGLVAQPYDSGASASTRASASRATAGCARC